MTRILVFQFVHLDTILMEQIVSFVLLVSTQNYFKQQSAHNVRLDLQQWMLGQQQQVIVVSKVALLTKVHL